jgi:hypothetical protein
LNNLFDALAVLKKTIGVFEMYKVSTFKCYRTQKDDGVQELTVEVWDAGSEEPSRYHVIATAKDGRVASGNAGSTIEEAIAFVHWGDLDK